MFVNYQIKPLVIKDLPAIMQIEKELYSHPCSATIMRDSILAAHTRAWGIFDNISGDLISYGIISIVMEESDLLNIAVDKKKQANGYGSIFIDFLAGKAKNDGAEKMFLEVRESNHVAIKLYQKLNFTKISNRSDYYPLNNNKRENAVVFMKKL